MGLFDFLKKKKKDADDAAPAPEGLTSLDGAALAQLEPPETRYTEEYQAYLAEQEAAAGDDAPAEQE